MRGHDRLDEDDVRVRPGKGSRPRTRRRPAHEDAADAFVTAVDRGRYRCWTGDHVVTAMKARELGRGGVVVGDRVRLAGDATGERGTLARVVQVLPRTSVLRRSAEDDDPVERIIVANADQLVIVTALASPPPRPRLIDRFLVAAYDARIEPLLCLTKSDLAAPDELLATYRPLGLRYLVTGRPIGAALEELRDLLAGRISVHGRALRRGQVDPGERAGTGRRPCSRHRQPGDRPRPAHLLVGRRAAAGRSGRRLDHRHAQGCAASARRTSPRTACCRRFPSLPTRWRSARLAAHTSRHAAHWTPGLPGTARTRPGSTRCGACCAAARAWSRPSPTTANHRHRSRR